MLQTGDRIGDWLVDGPLGEGGMGAVFRCHNVLSERMVAAVKVQQRAGTDEHTRFVREVESLAALDHPAIVRVLGGGEDVERGLLYLAMELVEGEDLEQRLRRGPMSVDEAQSYFHAVAGGLAHAHQAGIFHRDIKPANLMIRASGAAVVVDFGLAVEHGSAKLTGEGQLPGTMAYLDPEALSAGPVDAAKSDVYALGLVLYEALTGKRAFDAGSGAAMMLTAKVRARAFDPGRKMGKILRGLCRQATAPKSRKRPPMADFWARIDPKARPAPRSWFGVLVRAALLVMAALAVVAMVGVVVLGMTGGGGLFAIGMLSRYGGIEDRLADDSEQMLRKLKDAQNNRNRRNMGNRLVDIRDNADRYATTTDGWKWIWFGVQFDKALEDNLIEDRERRYLDRLRDEALGIR